MKNTHRIYHDNNKNQSVGNLWLLTQIDTYLKRAQTNYVLLFSICICKDQLCLTLRNSFNNEIKYVFF